VNDAAFGSSPAEGRGHFDEAKTANQPATAKSMKLKAKDSPTGQFLRSNFRPIE
jgi:hypothetical protein